MQELLKRIPGLEAVRQSVIITDTAGIVTYWNEPAAALLGWSAEEALGCPLSEILTLEPTPSELLQRVDSDPDWSGEMALRKRQGTAFLARVHSLAVTDEGGAITGIVRLVSDITDATWARRRELEHGQRAIRALHSSGVGSWHMDTATGLTTWDETMERLFGLEPGTFPGSRDSWRALIHEADRDWAIEEVRKAVATAPAHLDIEYRVVRPDGSEIWVKILGGAARGAGATGTAFAGVAFDITERRRAEEERAAFLSSERARRDRFTLLAEASAALAESLDDEDVMAAVGKLAVPRLADWFALDLVEPTGVTTVATVHNDPARGQRLDELARRYGSNLGIVPEVAEVIAESRAQLIATVELDRLLEATADDDHRAALVEVGLHSLMIVPLTAGGRTFGAMTFAIGDSDLSYSANDLDLAEDLGRRAALSLDNARLFADRTHVARVLQRSLLPPELPEVPGAALAARYRAAVAGSDIGGDFYDVFQTADSRWSLVLGDVSGKGTDAAVLTGLARHTLRAAAIGAPGPTEVLQALNHAVMAPEYGERFVTVAYVQMALHGDAADLVVCSAGHPSPLILREDGQVEEIGEIGGIIGLFDDVEIAPQSVELCAGDLLVLYTDGVLEARDSTGEFYGEDRLRDLLASAEDHSPDAVADRIETAAMEFQDGTPRDDIAILVVGIDSATALPQEPSS